MDIASIMGWWAMAGKRALCELRDFLVWDTLPVEGAFRTARAPRVLACICVLYGTATGRFADAGVAGHAADAQDGTSPGWVDSHAERDALRSSFHTGIEARCRSSGEKNGCMI